MTIVLIDAATLKAQCGFLRSPDCVKDVVDEGRVAPLKQFGFLEKNLIEGSDKLIKLKADTDGNIELLPEKVPRWDPEFSGDNLRIRENNRSVSSVNGRHISGVQSAQPCSLYSAQIMCGKHIMIGFAPRFGFQKNKDNFETCGWFLFVANGKLWSQDGIFDKAYGTAIEVGSIVTAIHDSTRHQIEFQVDGKSLGIAFTNVKHTELFAAAEIWNDSEIRITGTL
jgi:hypothetical protein